MKVIDSPDPNLKLLVQQGFQNMGSQMYRWVTANGWSPCTHWHASPEAARDCFEKNRPVVLPK